MGQRGELGFVYADFPNLDKIGSIAIILLGAIGDAVCLTAALSYIRETFPNIKVYLITEKTVGEFFPHSLVDELFLPEGTRFSESDILSLVSSLSSKGIDVVVNLHSTDRAAYMLASFMKKGLNTFGLHYDGDKYWVRGTVFHDLFHRVFYMDFYDDYIAPWVLTGRSAMMGLCLGVIGLFEPVVEVDETINISELGLNGDYAVLVPDANAPARMWPLDYYVRLSELIYKELNVEPVILGRKAEKIKFPAYVYDLRGKTSLSEAIAVIKHSKFVVSNDTGSIHIAGSFARPLLVVCGPNNVGPEAKGRFLTVRYPVECSPCRRPVCESMKCMYTLKPEYVFDCLQWLLKRKDSLPEDLVVGFSQEKKLDLFFDYHPLDIPYTDASLASTNFIKWAWIISLIQETLGTDAYEKALMGFEDYFLYLYKIEDRALFEKELSMVRNFLEQKLSLLLPIHKKLGILIKKGGRRGMPEVYSTVKKLLDGIPIELLYPFNYSKQQDITDLQRIIFIIINRARTMSLLLDNCLARGGRLAE